MLLLLLQVADLLGLLAVVLQQALDVGLRVQLLPRGAEVGGLRRGGDRLAEVAGAGWSFDAADETAPDVDGQAQAMTRALRDAQVAPTDIDYVNAHGTSTKLNDKTETAAIKQVFGQRAYRIPISSNKSMVGHLAAAAGAVEAVAAVLTLRDQILPPTINYHTPDPECDLDYVPNEARPHKVNACISNSFGLGGQNACLVLRRYQG